MTGAVSPTPEEAAERLAQIERELRHAQATRPTPTDSWLNGYAQDVAWLVAALRDARRERDRLQHFIDCADTPLMRDVLRERDQARDALARIQEAARRGKIECEGVTVDAHPSTLPNIAIHWLTAIRKMASLGGAAEETGRHA